MINRILIFLFIIITFSLFYSCKNDPISISENNHPKNDSLITNSDSTSTDSTNTNNDSTNINMSLKEIFPLSLGKSYLYSYYYYTRPNISSYFNSESGTIQYIMLDSSKLSDTIVQWQVKEIKHLYHKKLINIGDTATYLIDTTNMFTLEEELKDLHELKCKSVVWTFPFVDSVFKYPGWSKTYPAKVYRYFHDEKYTLDNEIYINSNYLLDTLSFYENKGMTYFRRDYAVQVMSGYYVTLVIKLIN